ncbi:hypothetical protein NCGM1984_1300 [Pseudomonas aeruginosa]|nr:hypothetical protein NCGM1984_1300 [Pseudomonas aeruginosa]
MPPLRACWISMPFPWSRSARCPASWPMSSAGWRRSKRCWPSSAISPWSIRHSRRKKLKATSKRASAWCCGSRKIASASPSIAGASCSVPTASRTTSPTCSSWRRCCRPSTARR